LDWFERLAGFPEAGYEDAKALLECERGILRSKANGRSYGVGSLAMPSLAELRLKASSLEPRLAGRLRLSIMQGDVRAMHRDPTFAGALFQVASQFNLLEMTSPMVTPEHGVTRYASDPTQGPACAIAAGAATIYRNYFVPLEGGEGQTRERQIDCLRELGHALGNERGELWRMTNGYAMCSRSGLSRVRGQLHAADDDELDALRRLLRIGFHRDVEATEAASPQRVSQVFCSALPVAYTTHPADEWEPFARLILEAAYEATLCCAAVNAAEGGSRTVLLTRLGGGAFGNETSWIHDALAAAVRQFRAYDIDVRIVTYGEPDWELRELVERLKA
jgi:hypothetical protein